MFLNQHNWTIIILHVLIVLDFSFPYKKNVTKMARVTIFNTIISSKPKVNIYTFISKLKNKK